MIEDEEFCNMEKYEIVDGEYVKCEQANISESDVHPELSFVDDDIQESISAEATETSVESKTDFKCKFCAKPHTSRYKLTHHLLRHRNRSIICIICNKSFLYNYELRIHNEKYHLKELMKVSNSEQSLKFKCKMCSKEFLTRRRLIMHLRRHREKSVVCDICSKLFHYNYELRIHNQEYHAEKIVETPKSEVQESLEIRPEISSVGNEESISAEATEGESTTAFKCRYCDKEFATKQRRSYHTLSHRKKSVICEICSMSFHYISKLHRHYESCHPGEIQGFEHPTEFNCKHCDKIFPKRTQLYHHLRVHKEKSLICEICSKQFVRNCELTAHMKRKHSNTIPEKAFKCETCCKNFFWKSDLLSHLQLHSNEKPFQCDQCDRTYCKKSYLKRHMKTHTGLHMRAFKCNICEKSFITPSALKLHLRIHTGETPFECNICQKLFKSNADVKMHSRIHSDEKPYKCEVCGTAFKHKNSCVDHSRIHTGDKPYKCMICDKIFSRLGILKRHTLTHTKEKPNKCTYCDHRTSRSSNLNVHMRRHQKEILHQENSEENQ